MENSQMVVRFNDPTNTAEESVDFNALNCIIDNL